jgi:hypothetical protein
MIGSEGHSGDKGGDKLYEHVRISMYLPNHVFAL